MADFYGVKTETSQFIREESWLKLLREELSKPYVSDLLKFVAEERKKHPIFPPEEMVFKALELCPPQKTKVVILGQDPYHGPGQAHGLAFSVPMGLKFPPSLRNIFKELQSDLNTDVPFSGDLTAWAEQGVLLLNSTLTVRSGEAGSHQKKGWEQLTDEIIRKLSEQEQHLVFILWGNYAIQKKELIDENRHLILSSAHPSPLSAHHGFFGTKPFSKANEYLIKHHKKPIHWELQ
ncbi:MAG: uracil-DNA glycosylase [Flavobacteriales bacterium]|nr:uracil-DNA glycosylase [Flavobacteriales bacterium]